MPDLAEGARILAQGSVVEGCIQCPYHGWEYNGSGSCTRMPSTAFCKGVRVSALPVTEADGFVWVWPGQDMPEPTVPAVTRPPEGFDVSFPCLLPMLISLTIACTCPACACCLPSSARACGSALCL